ncbi:MAG: hypothetical protein ABI831_22280 [Betaproteobacteria bacterium]
MVHFHVEDYASHYRFWVVSSQMLSERSEAEAGTVSLFADAEDNEAAQDTLKGQGIDAECACQFGRTRMANNSGPKMYDYGLDAQRPN